MNSFETVLSAIETLPVGIHIPKPQSANSAKLEGWCIRRGERALVYSMPNHSKPDKRHKKGVTVCELRQAYERLVATGEFTRSWFKEWMPDCNREGACNYTTIGSVFELVRVAKHSGPGVYRIL
jgi:hypothetical protein